MWLDKMLEDALWAEKLCVEVERYRCTCKWEVVSMSNVEAFREDRQECWGCSLFSTVNKKEFLHNYTVLYFMMRNKNCLFSWAVNFAEMAACANAGKFRYPPLQIPHRLAINWHNIGQEFTYASFIAPL